jgi:hypothetical protein
LGPFRDKFPPLEFSSLIASGSFHFDKAEVAKRIIPSEGSKVKMEGGGDYLPLNLGQVVEGEGGGL